MLVVGVIGVCSVAYFAFVLENSVSKLGNLYSAGEEKHLLLEEISTSFANFRAISLRHLASEDASTMRFFKIELEQLKQTLQNNSRQIFFQQTPGLENLTEIKQDLKLAINDYFKKIDEAIELSTDFEKESAFELVINAEYEYLPIINSSLTSIKIHLHEEAASSRTALLSVASKNLFVTISVGIIGGGLVLVIAFIVTRRVTKRLSHLLKWSHKVSSGDLSAPLATDSHDEVGLLTNSMIDMAKNIQRSHLELAEAKQQADKVADKLRLYAKAFEKSGEAILISDKRNKILNVNEAFIKLTGYSREEVLGKDPKFLSGGNTPLETYQELWTALKNDNFWQGELWDKRKCGKVYPKWVAISAIRDENNQVMFYIASFKDITERKESEARIEHLAHHDILTGLNNRFSLEDRLKQSLALAQRDKSQLAVFFIDLDRFKFINDSLGHHSGDQLLIAVAERLKDCVRDSDIIARIGGDEFVIVLNGLKDIAFTINVAENILKQITQSFEINGHKLNTSPSIGISFFPDDGNSAETLLKNADTAMYHAKEKGRNNYYFFTESMHVKAQQQIKIERELRKAIKKQQLQLYYQPQMTAEGNNIHSLEALIRWNHPVQGMISPDQFIPIAEQSHLILDLGRWVLNEACRQLEDWKNHDIRYNKLAINLSVKQLQSEELIDDVIAIMDKYQINGSELEFEITETATMNEPDLAVQQMSILRGLGISLAIDDFGTGYSSLAYLKRLPIQTLKLDKSFVNDMENDPNDAEICMATVALGHNLGLKVVAEGVETETQRDFLIKHNCDYLQGYLFSKPLPAEDIVFPERCQAIEPATDKQDLP